MFLVAHGAERMSELSLTADLKPSMIESGACQLLALDSGAHIRQLSPQVKYSLLMTLNAGMVGRTYWPVVLLHVYA